MKVILTEKDVRERHRNLVPGLDNKTLDFTPSENSAVNGVTQSISTEPGVFVLKKVKPKNVPKGANKKTQGDIDQDTIDEFNNCYKFYTDPNALNKTLKDKKKFHVWCTHYTGRSYSPSTSNWLFNRMSYESFCTGWLQYHDLIVTQKQEDHDIHFDWSKENVVMIYISAVKKRRATQRIYIDIFPPANGNDDGDAPDPPDPPGPPPPMPGQ
ncbi:MAG: hypothetical protein H7122_03930 [Chitinophagaceae bacterium]|nr:hypothetical protein [Chitinophagaceae bacterium]